MRIYQWMGGMHFEPETEEEGQMITCLMKTLKIGRANIAWPSLQTMQQFINGVDIRGDAVPRQSVNAHNK